MRLLLDTHALIWALEAPERLPPRIQNLFQRPEVVIFVSPVSTWEIAIKVALGRLTIPLGEIPRALADAAFRELPVSITQTLEIARLPPIHRDPFDRLLIAQAHTDGLTLVTRDRVIRRYPIATLWD